MATSTSLPHRSIVIFGRKGAGKSTVGNSLSQSNKFPVGRILASKEEWPSRTEFISNNVSYTFYMVDAIPRRRPTTGKLDFPENISLMIFVFRYGCFTQEEKQFFEMIIGFFNEQKLSTIAALVVTGCDDLSEESKDEYKRIFQEEEESKKIARVMQRGIFCVALPDESKLNAKQREIYKEDIRESHDILQRLLKMSTQTLPFESMLKLSDASITSLHQGNVSSDILSRVFNKCNFL